MIPPQSRLTLVVAESAPGPLGRALFEAVRGDLEDGTLAVIVVSESEISLISEAKGEVTWVACPSDSTVPRRRAMGLARARTPIVALTESFCVPAPGWVRAVLRAHAAEGPAAVGGPVNRQDGGPVDWALTLIEYGRFFGKVAAGSVVELPGINVAYDIDRVSACAGGVPSSVVEIDLDRLLVEAGETLWREPDAVMFDESHRSLAGALRSQFHHGRLFGGGRVAERGLRSRIFRFAVTPLVPFVLGGRITRGALSGGAGSQLLRALPALCALLASWAIGEAVGSLFGEGDSAARWR